MRDVGAGYWSERVEQQIIKLSRADGMSKTARKHLNRIAFKSSLTHEDKAFVNNLYGLYVEE